ncbi:CD209 antigen-like protein B [Drosophila pseudoobscura]|uniref:CD209 antigen-like protein B n=1 Tax=Drosophila pseudoobscura pseudoobscura TaxID=46245 RepID=A0A6I8UYE1_DROPS|nr:CD209 antigen-like protein B [Drosophila pseudoobscura]
MQCSIVFILFAITFGRSLSGHCEVDESQHECGGYCYVAVKPVLEYLAILQNRVESYEAKQPADTQSRIAEMDKKLETLGRELEIQQELKKSSQQVDTLSPLAEIEKNEKLEAGLERIQQELEKSSKQMADTLSKIAQIDEKLYAQGRQIEIQQELTKITHMRLQRLLVFEKIGSKYYYIERKIKMNWSDALHKCREMGAHLASLQSEDEIKALYRVLQPNQWYWIDLNDIKKDREFISATTGLPGTFFHWHENEPNNKDNSEHCVELYTFMSTSQALMNDQSCSDGNFFICQTSWDKIQHKTTQIILQ